MTRKMIREFIVEERTTQDMWYQIRIFDAKTRHKVDEIWYPTMEFALRELQDRGYREVVK